ncbi:hypothetical protein SAMN02787118_111176 [Streptomyces mirabilis]|uniref:Uncharacterized protein n=1 Tax=Streptomyces mirabilis TaxID=68239 RepID=A0A1I2L2D5_9ACTN|nr:hypothetical protein SAMN02787118_111176 [Streptomyces mirabilis]
MLVRRNAGKERQGLLCGPVDDLGSGSGLAQGLKPPKHGKQEAGKAVRIRVSIQRAFRLGPRDAAPQRAMQSADNCGDSLGNTLINGRQFRCDLGHHAAAPFHVPDDAFRDITYMPLQHGQGRSGAAQS